MTDNSPRASSRRSLLAAAGAVVVAGCADADDSSDAAAEESTDASGGNASDDGEASNGSTGDDGAGGESTDEDEPGGESTGEDEPGDESADEGTIHADYESVEVRVLSPEGDERGAVTAAVADTDERKVTGLSDTESLPSDRGMLFPYESADERQFVMREMDFGIDIVYADADGTITGFYNAPEPGPDEDGSEQLYVGRGKYVLEVVYGWTNDHGVREDDVLEFDLEGW